MKGESETARIPVHGSYTEDMAQGELQSHAEHSER